MHAKPLAIAPIVVGTTTIGDTVDECTAAEIVTAASDIGVNSWHGED
jgi:aryl-alcohol dehydrogenase-like predicted oxidoreductase